MFFTWIEIQQFQQHNSNLSTLNYVLLPPTINALLKHFEKWESEQKSLLIIQRNAAAHRGHKVLVYMCGFVARGQHITHFAHLQWHVPLSLPPLSRGQTVLCVRVCVHYIAHTYFHTIPFSVPSQKPPAHLPPIMHEIARCIGKYTTHVHTRAHIVMPSKTTRACWFVSGITPKLHTHTTSTSSASHPSD